MKRFLFILLTCLILPSSSWAVMRLGIVGIANRAYVDSEAVSYSPGNSFGAGALLDVGMDTRLEVGLLYIPRKFSSQVGTFNTEVSVKTLQVPVLVRFGNWISLGIGGYLAKTLATDATVRNGGGAATATSSQIREADYGALASLALNIPAGAITSLVVDGRYLHGISEDIREFQLLAGVKFGL